MYIVNFMTHKNHPKPGCTPPMPYASYDARAQYRTPHTHAPARPWHARTHTLGTHARPRDTHTSRTCSHTSLLAEWKKKHTSPFATPFLALLPC